MLNLNPTLGAKCLVMVKTADEFFEKGCGRCSLWNTPNCKVNTWHEELLSLRKILNDSELTEDCKWGFPCYVFNNENVVLLGAFKDFVSLNFFKGILLDDPSNLLSKAGENTQAARLFKFTSTIEVTKNEVAIRDFIKQAIELARTNTKVELPKAPIEIPVELQDEFDKDPVFHEAFESLTPGRQRGYIMYFSAPKQSKTRTSRIQQSVSKILNGEGMHDAYKQSQKKQ